MLTLCVLLLLVIAAALLAVGWAAWHTGYAAGRLDEAAQHAAPHPAAIAAVTPTRRPFDQDAPLTIGARRG